MHKKEYKVIGTILYKCSLSLCNRFPIMYIEYWSSSAGGGGGGKPFQEGPFCHCLTKGRKDRRRQINVARKALIATFCKT